MNLHEDQESPAKRRDGAESAAARRRGAPPPWIFPPAAAAVKNATAHSSGRELVQAALKHSVGIYLSMNLCFPQGIFGGEDLGDIV